MFLFTTYCSKVIFYISVMIEESNQSHDQSNSLRDSFSNTENRRNASSLTDPATDQFEIFEKRLSAYQGNYFL